MVPALDSLEQALRELQGRQQRQVQLAEQVPRDLLAMQKRQSDHLVRVDV